ncbi:MAG TPA: methyltransferase domain-containing protein [Blastocatellia bacterium]|nr:methyltransferase domain-containing protein [Blastocatellia bacterium]
MPVSMDIIQADFDRIALLSQAGGDHNSHYHRFLLGQLPPRLLCSLEIGCGTGAFARRLAERSDKVLALDLSPEMIRSAGENSRWHPNIDFRVADVLTTELPAGHFDCVVSIATLHHLPMEETLVRIKNAMKPGGTLLVLDLRRTEGLSELAAGAMAWPVSAALRLIVNGRLIEPPELRRAWNEHGRNDSYLTTSQVRRICADLLPGAVVRKHLLWRYSVVWQKPSG